MDERLEKAIAFANYKTTVFQQKQNLKLRLENMLTYAVNGGMFKITDQLISFVDVLVRRGLEEAVLIDSRDNPVLINELGSFHDTIIALYFEAANEYHLAHSELKKARSVSQAVKL